MKILRERRPIAPVVKNILVSLTRRFWACQRAPALIPFLKNIKVPISILPVRYVSSLVLLTLLLLAVAESTSFCKDTPKPGKSPDSKNLSAVKKTQATKPASKTLLRKPVNNFPTISPIVTQILGLGGATGPLPFTVGDIETPPSKLRVSVTSSNPALIPVGNVILGGSGSKRTVTITPSANQVGTSFINLTVTDADGAAASIGFALMVNASGAGVKLTTDQLSFIKANAPVVSLNRLVYEAGHSITATVEYQSLAQRQGSPLEILIVSSQTLDAERVVLVDDAQMPRRTTSTPLSIQLIDANAKPTQIDNVLQVRPGEVFLAMVSYQVGNPKFPLNEMISADFGLIFDPAFAGSPVQVVPTIALQPDEADAQVYGKSLATVAMAGGYAIGQVPVNELLFAPRSQEQLTQFLQLTGGTVTESHGKGPVPDWVTVRVSPPKMGKYLPQLRDLYGDPETLLSSRPEAVDLYAYGYWLNLEGYQVALNPRVFTFSDAKSEEDASKNVFAGEALGWSMNQPIFGVREMWANMAMWDMDLQRVKVAFIDEGFSANDDWRDYPTGVLERDVWTGDTGTGAALGPPTVGGNFFDDLNWHGTGVLSIAGGMLNNGVGTVGTGGQVVSPNLYEMNLGAYVSLIGDTIEQAVTDGAQVINLSAGFPCRFLWRLGPENVCTALGRAAFTAKMDLIVALSFTVCGVTGAVLGPIAALACSVAAVIVSEAAAILPSLVAFSETRGHMEKAVDTATAAGVPVVSISGNKIDPDSLGAFSAFVTDKQLADTDVDDWQIIPGVIPDVICVASAHANPDTNYANIDFYGDSVDIWAPIHTQFYAPSDDDVVTAGPAEYQTGFEGTSAAVPYISGIIANMMAVNPALDPKRAGALGADLSKIPSKIAEILDDTAYKPGDPELPESYELSGITKSEAAAMDVRRNLVNANAAWQEAAAEAGIPNAADLGMDQDNGHQSDGTSSALGEGDDIGDTSICCPTPPKYSLYANPAGQSVTDEIHFIWPQKPSGLAQTDGDYFQWNTPPDPAKIYRQQIDLTVPNYPKSLPWLSYWHGERSGAVGSTNTYTFYTPWLAVPGTFDFLLTTPQFTDTPYKLDIAKYEEKAALSADEYDTPPATNDSDASPASLSGAWIDVSGSLTAQPFESYAWEMTPVVAKTLTLHSETDLDWYQLIPPAVAAMHAWDPCAPIFWIRVLPYDPNIKITVMNPTTKAIIKEGKGSEPMALFRSDYGVGWLLGVPGANLLLGIQSFSKTLHEYSLTFRLSVPLTSFCCCWHCIVTADFAPYKPVDVNSCITAGCPGIPGSVLEPDLIALDGSRVLTNLQSPAYLGVSTVVDSQGHILTPRTVLLHHIKKAKTDPFWVSAFLGHDRNFEGYDQSLRMDLFDVTNCGWLAGVITLNGTTQVIYDTSGPAPASAPYKIGDLDLYMSYLDDGDYLLTLTYFKEGDSVDLLLNDSCIRDKSPSVQNAYDGSGYGTNEVIIGPDADTAPDMFPAPFLFYPF